MNLPIHWLSMALVAATLACLLVARRAWRIPRFPGQIDFVLLLLSVAWWTAAVAVEHLSDSPETKVFWSEMSWLGIVGTPSFYGLFTWNYILGQKHSAPRPLYAAIALVAVATWVAALTNGGHHLIYSATAPYGEPPYMTVRYSHGPLFFVLTGTAYLIFFLAQILMFYKLFHTRGVYRAHYFGLSAALCLPWLINFARLAGLFHSNVDPTPFSFFLMCALYYWLIGRRHLFNLLPVAQGVLLDALPDPVLVIDTDSRIAECNPAARQLIGDRPLIGAALNSIPELQRGLGGPAAPDAPGEVVIGTPPRYFDVAQVPLSFADRNVGRLVLLRDISHRKEAENRLQAALVELEKQLQNNLELQQRLREESIRDALTGLHNRRFFDEVAPAMLADAARTGASLAAVMIDLDHFKRLNDGYGHSAGDAVLRATGAFLRQNIRQSDAVFRMGGEEFLVLMPHAQPAQTLERVEAWRIAFAGQTITHEGVDLSVTFSAGIAFYPDDSGRLAELLQRSDAALYRAKAQGRNNCVRWQR